MKVFDEQQLKRVYDYIVEYQRTENKSPGYRAIMKACGLGSLSTVARNVEELQVRGLLEKDKLEYGRGIIAMLPSLDLGKTKPMSLCGECPCGKPIEAIENIEGTFQMPVELFGNGEHIMLRAKGYSMIDMGITNGDIMCVNKDLSAKSGDVVVAMIDGEATAKIYLPKRDKVILRAANDSVDEDGNRTYPDIVTKECSIVGVVDNVIHKPRLR